MNQTRDSLIAVGIVTLCALASLVWQLTTSQGARLSSSELPSYTGIPDNTGSRMTAVQALLKRGDSKRALPLLRALENDSHRVPGMYGILGDLYRQAGQVDRAYALLRGTLSVAPNDSTTLVRMGYLELSLGERESALGRFLKARSAAPRDPEPLLAEAFYHDQEGKLALAEPLLREALAATPERWNIAVLLADNQAKQKRYDVALTSLEALRQRYPSETQLHAQQGRTLLDAADAKPGQAKTLRQRATEVLDDAIKLAPEDVSLYFEQGRAWRDLGDRAKAQQAWEEGYRLNANYPQLAGQLGNLLLRQGDQARGRRLLAEEARSEEGRTSFNVEVGKVMQAWKDGRARRRFAQWCATNKKTARAILEWERLLRDYPGDTEAVREIERLKKSEIE